MVISASQASAANRVLRLPIGIPQVFPDADAGVAILLPSPAGIDRKVPRFAGQAGRQHEFYAVVLHDLAVTPGGCGLHVLDLAVLADPLDQQRFLGPSQTHVGGEAAWCRGPLRQVPGTGMRTGRSRRPVPVAADSDAGHRCSTGTVLPLIEQTLSRVSGRPRRDPWRPDSPIFGNRCSADAKDAAASARSLSVNRCGAALNALPRIVAWIGMPVQARSMAR